MPGYEKNKYEYSILTTADGGVAVQPALLPAPLPITVELWLLPDDLDFFMLPVRSLLPSMVSSADAGPYTDRCPCQFLHGELAVKMNTAVLVIIVGSSTLSQAFRSLSNLLPSRRTKWRRCVPSCGGREETLIVTHTVVIWCVQIYTLSCVYVQATFFRP